MDWILFLKMMILALVEAVTEFLPVSSTGHLILIGNLLDIGKPDFEAMFNIVIQLAAILSVLFVFFDKIWDKVIAFFKGKRDGIHFLIICIIGAFPAAVAGFLLHDLIFKYLMNPLTVALGLLVGALFLLILEKPALRKARVNSIEQVSLKQAFTVGLAQCLALWPGMSRSAVTIMGGWVSGLKTKVAAEYSFFLAIPIMFGAAGYSLFKFLKDDRSQSVASQEWLMLLICFVFTFFVSLFLVKKFLKFVSKYSLSSFAYYRIILAFLILIKYFIK